jgi:hypothetical protein
MTPELNPELSWHCESSKVIWKDNVRWPTQVECGNRNTPWKWWPVWKRLNRLAPFLPTLGIDQAEFVSCCSDDDGKMS